jgi:hypothetical protein
MLELHQVYAPGHQVSSDQELGLATKPHTKWQGSAYNLLHYSP